MNGVKYAVCFSWCLFLCGALTRHL